MLHEQVVETGTLELIKRLCSDGQLSSFCLVGGTALALQLGHRRSEDIDLFTQEDIETTSLNAYLSNEYSFSLSFVEKNTLKGDIRGVKVDLITFPYRMVNPMITEGGMRLAGRGDIAAMKLSAIAQNGTRLKDFVDIAFLSSTMSFSEMIDCYAEKFPNSNPVIPLKAVSYFDDINFNESIAVFNARFDWEKIRKRILAMQRSPHTVFPSAPL